MFQRHKAVPQLTLTTLCFFLSFKIHTTICNSIFVYWIFSSFRRRGTSSVLFSPEWRPHIHDTPWILVQWINAKSICHARTVLSKSKGCLLWNQKQFLKLFMVFTCNSLHPERNTESPIVLRKIPCFLSHSSISYYTHTTQPLKISSSPGLHSPALAFLPAFQFLPNSPSKMPKTALERRASAQRARKGKNCKPRWRAQRWKDKE